MDLETRAIDVGDLEDEGFMEPEAQAIDRGSRSGCAKGGGREEALDLRRAEDGGEPVGGWRRRSDSVDQSRLRTC